MYSIGFNIVNLFISVCFRFLVGMNYGRLRTLLNPNFDFVESVNRVLGGITNEQLLKQVRYCLTYFKCFDLAIKTSYLLKYVCPGHR